MPRGRAGQHRQPLLFQTEHSDEWKVSIRRLGSHRRGRTASSVQESLSFCLDSALPPIKRSRRKKLIGPKSERNRGRLAARAKNWISSSYYVRRRHRWAYRLSRPDKKALWHGGLRYGNRRYGEKKLSGKVCMVVGVRVF